MKFKYLVLITALLATSVLSCKAQGSKWKYADYKRYKSIKKAIKNKSDVVVLDLSSKGLKSIPSEVFELDNLKVLILVDNEISSLPGDIQRLHNLERLELMKNKLKALPIELTQLKKLERLNVAYNEIYEKDVKFLKDELPNCFVLTDIIL